MERGRVVAVGGDPGVGGVQRAVTRGRAAGTTQVVVRFLEGTARLAGAAAGGRGRDADVHPGHAAVGRVVSVRQRRPLLTRGKEMFI